MAQGHRVTSIGKLHYVDSDPQRNGFNEEILPLHIVNGVGDLLGLIRDELPRRAGLGQARPGSGPRRIGIHALRPFDRRRDREVAAQRGAAARDKPWALYVGFVSPHFPLIAPPEFYAIYPEDKVPWPDMYERASGRSIRSPTPCASACASTSPSMRRWCAARSRPTWASSRSSTTTSARSCARSKRAGLADNTRVIYTQRSRRQPRHARHVGQIDDVRGVGGHTADPGRARRAAQATCATTPVSARRRLPDLHARARRAADPRDAALPGHSLLDIAQGYVPERTMLSEYHAPVRPSPAPT